jgi:hypothetical protein
MGMEGRKIIQIAIGDLGYIVAMCDDGTVWFRRGVWDNSDPWYQIPPIPRVEELTPPSE